MPIVNAETYIRRVVTSSRPSPNLRRNAERPTEALQRRPASESATVLARLAVSLPAAAREPSPRG